MLNYKMRLGAAGLAALLCGTAAMADVTAEQVWQSWVDYSTTMGQTIETGGQTRSGDTLVITDAVLSASQPDGSFRMTVPEIRLRETGGRVEITTSEEVVGRVDMTGDAGEAVSVPMRLTQQGNVTTASGTPEDMTYDFLAPQLGVEIGGITVDGEPVDMALSVTFRDTTGNYRTIQGDVTRVTSQIATASAEIDMTVTDPEDGGRFALDGAITGLSGQSDVTTPGAMDPEDLAASLRAGLAASGTLAYGPGSYRMTFSGGGQAMDAQVTGQGGSGTFSLSEAGMTYAVASQGTALTASSPDLPFPINMSLGETGLSFAMPLTAGQDAPFGFGLRLVDLVLPEEIWAMVDPAGQLPRDPATLILELSGRADMTADLTDPAVAEMAAPPGELRALDLNRLQLTAVGADLTGQGALTFDNSDLSMGFPRPTGAIDLALTGGNALLDRLVAMGFLPEDQAMGARMMLGLFAVPTGPDALSSKIEFRDDGGIYANGQRIQ